MSLPQGQSSAIFRLASVIPLLSLPHPQHQYFYVKHLPISQRHNYARTSVAYPCLLPDSASQTRLSHIPQVLSLLPAENILKNPHKYKPRLHLPVHSKTVL